MKIFSKFLLSLSLIISQNLFSMEIEEKYIDDEDNWHEQSPISKLPDELKLNILIMGLYLIIQNNKIYEPFKFVGEYIQNIALVNQDFGRFAICLDKAAEEIAKNYFALLECKLSQKELNEKLNLTRSWYRDIKNDSLTEVAKLIIAGADVNQIYTYSGDCGDDDHYLLNLLVNTEIDFELKKKYVLLLIFYGAHINGLGADFTVLSTALRKKDKEMEAFLLEHGADPKLETPYMIATRHDDLY